MKRITKFALVAALSLMAGVTSQAQVITNWTFENAAVVNATGSDFTYGPADSGLLSATSSATGHHASASTSYSFIAGQAPSTPRSLNSNNWAVADYYQFTLSTLAFTSLQVSFGQAGSATGPRDFQFQYSDNAGASFTNFGALLVLTTSFQTFSFDLSGIASLNNNPSIAFRIVDTSAIAINGGTVSATGTDRIDNFVVTATPIPEPATYMLFGIGLLACAQRFRRSKKG